MKRCKRRYIRQAQEAVTLGPKGKWPSSGVGRFSDADDAPPADRRDLTRPGINAERGKPDLLLNSLKSRKADRKGSPGKAG